ncbi:hypothetical protein C0995_011477 [Termitomyces sp. Mi166|nr:hypothetical protein C0995_011477 [Termitomyces sp. Mi166\
MSAGEIFSTDIPDWYFAKFGESYPIHPSLSIVKLEQNPPHEAAKQPPPFVTPEITLHIFGAVNFLSIPMVWALYPE